MAKKKKTRFYVRVNKLNHELFSVSQQKDGDLIIAIKSNRYYEVSRESYIPLRSQKISVHVSKGSVNGNTFTMTSEIEDGEKNRAVTFVERIDGELLHNVFSRRCSSMASGHFKMKARTKDRTVKVAEYDENFNNLIYHIYVCSKNIGSVFRNKRADGIYFSEAFQFFDIILIPTFINMRAIMQGDGHFSLSSDVYHGQVIVKAVDRKAIISSTLENFNDVIASTNGGLLKVLDSRIDGLTYGPEELLRKIKARNRDLSPFPFVLPPAVVF
jgi:hypothetical protein